MSLNIFEMHDRHQNYKKEVLREFDILEKPLFVQIDGMYGRVV